MAAFPSPSIVPKKKATKTSPYNPYAYVPGGAPVNVAKAIQQQGFAQPGPNPIYVPRTPAAQTIDTSGFGGNYTDTGTADYTAPATGSSTDPTTGDVYETKTREYTPDEMQALIMADPMYGIGQTRYQTALDQGMANIVRTPTQQAVRGFGAIDFTQVPADIRQQLQDLLGPAASEEDPMSTMAQLRGALGRATNKVAYTLAARQAGRSGASAVLQRRLNEGFSTQSYQEMQALLKAIADYQSQYANFASGQGSAWDALRESITSRLAQRPGPTYKELVSRGGVTGGVLPGEIPYTPKPEEPVDTGFGPGGNSPSYGFWPIQPGDVIDAAGNTAPENINDYPWLNPTMPSEPFTATRVGDTTSFEPRPTDVYNQRSGLAPAELLQNEMWNWGVPTTATRTQVQQAAEDARQALLAMRPNLGVRQPLNMSMLTDPARTLSAAIGQTPQEQTVQQIAQQLLNQYDWPAPPSGPTFAEEYGAGYDPALLAPEQTAGLSQEELMRLYRGF